MSQKLLQRFRIIVVEFHQLDRLWNRDFYKLAEATFDKILLTHTCGIFIQTIFLAQKKGNRDSCACRIYFYSQRQNYAEISQNCFPDPLDFDNTTGKHIALPTCWYGE